MITTCTKCNKQLLTEADPYLIVPVDNYAVVCYDCVVKPLKQCGNCKHDWVVDQEGSVRNKEQYLNKCNICGDREKWELKDGT